MHKPEILITKLQTIATPENIDFRGHNLFQHLHGLAGATASWIYCWSAVPQTPRNSAREHFSHLD